MPTVRLNTSCGTPTLTTAPATMLGPASALSYRSVYNRMAAIFHLLAARICELTHILWVIVLLIYVYIHTVFYQQWRQHGL